MPFYLPYSHTAEGVVRQGSPQRDELNGASCLSLGAQGTWVNHRLSCQYHFFSACKPSRDRPLIK